MVAQYKVGGQRVGQRLISWSDALVWADGFSFAGYTDRRLPKGDIACGGDPASAAKWGIFWYTELGNSAGAMTNPGGFIWDYYAPRWNVLLDIDDL